MKKRLLGLVVVALLAGGGLFGAAQAAENEGCTSDAPGGNPLAGQVEICGGFSSDGTGYLTVDGNGANADPMDGYISVANDGSQDEDGVCASDEGDPGEEYDQNGNRIENDAEQPTCVNP